MTFNQFSRDAADLFGLIAGTYWFYHQLMAIRFHFEFSLPRDPKEIEDRFFDYQAQAITNNCKVLSHKNNVITEMLFEQEIYCLVLYLSVLRRADRIMDKAHL